MLITQGNILTSGTCPFYSILLSSISTYQTTYRIFHLFDTDISCRPIFQGCIKLNFSCDAIQLFTTIATYIHRRSGKKRYAVQNLENRVYSRSTFFPINVSNKWCNAKAAWLAKFFHNLCHVHNNGYYKFAAFYVCTAAIFHIIKFRNRGFIFSFNFYKATIFLLNANGERAMLIIILISAHKIIIIIIINVFFYNNHCGTLANCKSRIFE